MFDLGRFVEAQTPVFSRVLDELSAGRKASHWMWFVFAQLRGLGHSEMAKRFAISGLAEARAYLEHDVLGPRLEECVKILLSHSEKSATQILGSPDDMKLRSCLTLFLAAHPKSPLYQQALDQFYSGAVDGRTVALLQGQNG
jgi:uncharacterized protein (DUF1810 family)